MSKMSLEDFLQLPRIFILIDNASSLDVFESIIQHPATESLLFSSVDELIEEERYNDDFDLTNNFTKGRTIEGYLRAYTDIQKVLPVLEAFNLQNKLQRGLQQCSSGEIRKTLLIRALCSDKKRLFLESPTEGFDAKSRKTFLEQLSDLSKDFIIVSNRVEDCPENVEIGVLTQNMFKYLGSSQKQLKYELSALDAVDYSNPPISLKDQNFSNPVFQLVNGEIKYEGETLFKGLNWTLNKGEAWMISGPNGCGKSSLLALIHGDHPACYTNDFSIFGFKRGTGESIWDIKKNIGFVSSLFHRDYRVPTSVMNVILSGFHDTVGVYGQSTAEEKSTTLEWLSFLNLTALKDQPFQSLSYGLQRIVLLIRALVKTPQLLLLDEPFVGLDYFNNQIFRKILEQMIPKLNLSLVYVSHHVEDEKLSCIGHELVFDSASKSWINKLNTN